ncbi:MAG: dienelactone hydrolase family protein [Comamonadaceae bacterium]|nr:dienelactone hydrolase family protein [Comamonadaceae bacterium]
MKRAWWLFLLTFAALGAARAEVKTEVVEYRSGDTVMKGLHRLRRRRPGEAPRGPGGPRVVGPQRVRPQARTDAGRARLHRARRRHVRGRQDRGPSGRRRALCHRGAQEPRRRRGPIPGGARGPRASPDGRRRARGGNRLLLWRGVVLEMARRGVDLDAVASFHGSLGTPGPARPGVVKARVLVLTGEADPMIPPDQVSAFRQEMDAAGVTYDVVVYPGATHSFTSPEADALGQKFNPAAGL